MSQLHVSPLEARKPAVRAPTPWRARYAFSAQSPGVRRKRYAVVRSANRVAQCRIDDGRPLEAELRCRSNAVSCKRHQVIRNPSRSATKSSVLTTTEGSTENTYKTSPATSLRSTSGLQHAAAAVRMLARSGFARRYTRALARRRHRGRHALGCRRQRDAGCRVVDLSGAVPDAAADPRRRVCGWAPRRRFVVFRNQMLAGVTTLRHTHGADFKWGSAFLGLM